MMESPKYSAIPIDCSKPLTASEFLERKREDLKRSQEEFGVLLANALKGILGEPRGITKITGLDK